VFTNTKNDLYIRVQKTKTIRKDLFEARVLMKFSSRTFIRLITLRSRVSLQESTRTRNILYQVYTSKDNILYLNARIYANKDNILYLKSTRTRNVLYLNARIYANKDNILYQVYTNKECIISQVYANKDNILYLNARIYANKECIISQCKNLREQK